MKMNFTSTAVYYLQTSFWFALAQQEMFQNNSNFLFFLIPNLANFTHLIYMQEHAKTLSKRFFSSYRLRLSEKTCSLLLHYKWFVSDKREIKENKYYWRITNDFL